MSAAEAGTAACCKGKEAESGTKRQEKSKYKRKLEKEEDKTRMIILRLIPNSMKEGEEGQ